jgi:hypothetical protein
MVQMLLLLPGLFVIDKIWDERQANQRNFLYGPSEGIGSVNFLLFDYTSCTAIFVLGPLLGSSITYF